MEVDPEGTLWFALDRFALTAFKPKGNKPTRASSTK